MAGVFRALRKTGQEIFDKCIINHSARFYASRSHTRRVKNLTQTSAVKRIDSLEQSLNSKGFLRSRRPYTPPENVAGKIEEIYRKFDLPTKKDYKFADLKEKFNVLEACFTTFEHEVPNSQLYEVNTVDDVIKFYETPVDTTTPLDALVQSELPENLHIQQNYVRFHPETDTMFNGKTAFPKSSTLVTGLKYREKYPGHIAKRSWP